MLTHASRLRANETDRECAIKRSALRVYTGNGVSARLHEDQVPGFVHRVRMLAHLSGQSFESIVKDRGLEGEAAAQVLAALEAE
jgi:hypothetical protein